ncbi:MAG: hypothetical protein VB083_02805 [Aminobacterium sp.]|nr:hypothetical protein [Aminobacterium sp.]MEA4876817.1 hypothetical protein [Aminobacterium sp.]
MSLHPGIFQYVESCLYNYRENRERLDLKRLELRNIPLLRSTTDYQERVNAGIMTSEPVAVIMLRIESIEEDIRRLEKKTEPVTRLIFTLREQRSPLVDLLDYRYFQQLPWDRCLELLHVSRGTFKSWRVRLIEKAARMLGFDPE